MKITIESVRIELTEALTALIQKKFGTFGKFVARFEADQETALQVEVSRTTRHHKQGDEVYRVMADLRLAKKMLRAEADGADLHVVIDDARNILKGEIEKYKEKVVESIRE